MTKKSNPKNLMSTNPKKAYEYAILCLNQRMYNANSMIEKLWSRGFDKQICIAVVDELLKNKYIDDYDYARRYSIDSVNFKKQGVHRIAYELKRKKINNEIIDHVVEDIYPLTLTALDNIVRSRLGYLHSCNDKEMRKLHFFLSRKGFSFNDIDNAIKKYQDLNTNS